MQFRFFLLTALSMSLGWRIRGQFGHEMGAAMPGALGAMAIVLLSGREDWWRRVHYFALFGALGWAFGGSMSYMKVVGYTHSSDSLTVLYGFAALFLIGFLWAALGGAGTSLPAVLDRQRLGGLFPALAAVFAAWFLQGIFVDWHEMMLRTNPEACLEWYHSTCPKLIRDLAERHDMNLVFLDWHDSDWLQAAVAILAVLLLAMFRWRVDLGTSLVLHLAIGWWIGFLVLVIALGVRLNPPRGDNWAGCIGIFAGWMLFCRRYGLSGAATVSLAAGFFGGVGFLAGQMLKLAAVSTGAPFSWHCVLEWLQGLFHGLALALAMAPLVRHGRERNGAAAPRWTGVFSIFFVLWGITYFNFRKSPALWARRVASFVEDPYGIAAVAGFDPARGWIGWFDTVYLALGAVVLVLLCRQRSRPLAFVPESWLGRGQLLYLVFLWLIVVISSMHEFAELTPQSFVIQWAIALNAVLCTWLMLTSSMPSPLRSMAGIEFDWARRIRQVIAGGLLAAVATSFAGWGVKRALFGDTFAGYFPNNHIRFGPDNTNDKK